MTNYLNLARHNQMMEASIKPINGISMAGFRPLLSDQGPTKRQIIMPGMEERIELYIVTVATSFCTAICSFSCALRLLHTS